MRKFLPLLMLLCSCQASLFDPTPRWMRMQDRYKYLSSVPENTPEEKELIKQLAALPEEVRQAARDYDPSHINRYVTELATRFHKFYTVCRIKDAEPGVLEARLTLCDCVRRVLEIALGIIGVSAPEKM